MYLCNDCALRLFNDKHYNLSGVGNPYFGNCIIVPNVDYNAYRKGDMDFSNQVEIIKDILHLSTGVGENLDNLYILPLIRCNESISCELDNNSYNRCLQYFIRDIYKYQFKRILLLGDAGRRFFKCDITKYLNTLIISRNNRFYNVNYSSLIKYTNEEKYEIFKIYLIKWYNWCNTNINNYNNIVNV